MDEERLIADLAEAESQVAEGKIRIARHAALLHRLERDGQDTTEARHLLLRLIEVQDSWEYRKDVIEREIDRLL
jgi:hypothetical protein